MSDEQTTFQEAATLLSKPTTAATERVSRALIAFARETTGRGSVDVRDITRDALVATLSLALRDE